MKYQGCLLAVKDISAAILLRTKEVVYELGAVDRLLPNK